MIPTITEKGDEAREALVAKKRGLMHSGLLLGLKSTHRSRELPGRNEEVIKRNKGPVTQQSNLHAPTVCEMVGCLQSTTHICEDETCQYLFCPDHKDHSTHDLKLKSREKALSALTATEVPAGVIEMTTESNKKRKKATTADGPKKNGMIDLQNRHLLATGNKKHEISRPSESGGSTRSWTEGISSTRP